MDEFRILAIDGGGIKGLFPASFLAALERGVDQPIGNYFDLVAGTSTGGIIALGLGLGFSADEMKQFYLEHGPSIFPRRTFWDKAVSFFRRLGRVAYTPDQLRSSLEGCFGSRKLGDSRRRLVIPSMDANTGRVHVFKTSHHPRLEVDYKLSAVDVALATAAAPTYFPAHLLEGIRLLDGGMWANNPSLVAVVEALYILGVPVSKVRILSVGCSESPMCLPRSVGEGGGRLHWATQVAEWFMRGQSESANGMVRLMLGNQNVMRVQPAAPPGQFVLDDFEAATPLIGIGEALAREHLKEVRTRFLQDVATPFVPEHPLVPAGESFAA